MKNKNCKRIIAITYVIVTLLLTSCNKNAKETNHDTGKRLVDRYKRLLDSIE